MIREQIDPVLQQLTIDCIRHADVESTIDIPSYRKRIVSRLGAEIEKMDNPYKNMGENEELFVGFEHCRTNILNKLKEGAE